MMRLAVLLVLVARCPLSVAALDAAAPELANDAKARLLELQGIADAQVGNRTEHLDDIFRLGESADLSQEDRASAAKLLNDRLLAFLQSQTAMESTVTMQELSRLLRYADQQRLSAVLAPSSQPIASTMTAFCRSLLDNIRQASQSGHVQHPLQEHLGVAREMEAVSRCPLLFESDTGMGAEAFLNTTSEAQRSLDAFMERKQALFRLSEAAQQYMVGHRAAFQEARILFLEANCTEELKPFELELQQREKTFADLSEKLKKVITAVRKAQRLKLNFRQEILEELNQAVAQADALRFYLYDLPLQAEARRLLRETEEHEVQEFLAQQRVKQQQREAQQKQEQEEQQQREAQQKQQLEQQGQRTAEL